MTYLLHSYPLSVNIQGPKNQFPKAPYQLQFLFRQCPIFFLQLGFLGIQNIANPDILLLEFPVDLNNGKLIENKT